jgi:hypothetical protein
MVLMPEPPSVYCEEFQSDQPLLVCLSYVPELWVDPADPEQMMLA